MARRELTILKHTFGLDAEVVVDDEPCLFPLYPAISCIGEHPTMRLAARIEDFECAIRAQQRPNKAQAVLGGRLGCPGDRTTLKRSPMPTVRIDVQAIGLALDSNGEARFACGRDVQYALAARLAYGPAMRHLWLVKKAATCQGEECIWKRR